MQTTTIPMIPLRLNHNTQLQATRSGNNNQNLQQNLKDSLNQDQVYISHKQILIKQQTVIYSREILVFYVHRRFQEIDISRIRSPYCLISLPNTLSQFEKLNSSEVQIEAMVELPGTQTSDKFDLTSFVYVQTAPINNTQQQQQQHVIYGCGACVKLNPNVNSNQ